MKQRLRILIAEDNPSDAELVLRELRRADFEPEWVRVDTEEEYIQHLTPELDLILSDYQMPRFDGIRALELLQDRQLDVPFIIISGTIGEETAVAVMKRGATDYLLKDRLMRLGTAVQQAMEQSRMRREHSRAEKAMQQSEHKYRRLFESLGEAAFLIDTASRRILDANLRAEILLGRSRTEILGMNAAKIFSPHEAADYCRKLTRLIPEGQTERETARIQAKDGTIILVRVSLAPIELYERVLVLALMADVTESK